MVSNFKYFFESIRDRQQYPKSAPKRTLSFRISARVLRMTDVLVGDALLELTKAKELANVMGGAWHSTEEDVDADSDAEQRRRSQQVNA